jgi:hypothetical protein
MNCLEKGDDVVDVRLQVKNFEACFHQVADGVLLSEASDLNQVIVFVDGVPFYVTVVHVFDCGLHNCCFEIFNPNSVGSFLLHVVMEHCGKDRAEV